jgi:hypothetical protein
MAQRDWVYQFVFNILVCFVVGVEPERHHNSVRSQIWLKINRLHRVGNPDPVGSSFFAESWSRNFECLKGLCHLLLPKLQLPNTENCLFLNFVSFFQKFFRGLVDFQDTSRLTLSGLKNCTIFRLAFSGFKEKLAHIAISGPGKKISGAHLWCLINQNYRPAS